MITPASRKALHSQVELAHWQRARLSGLRSLLSCVKLPCCLWSADCCSSRAAVWCCTMHVAQVRHNTPTWQPGATFTCHRPAAQHACNCTTLPPSRICLSCFCKVATESEGLPRQHHSAPWPERSVHTLTSSIQVNDSSRSLRHSVLLVTT